MKSKKRYITQLFICVLIGGSLARVDYTVLAGQMTALPCSSSATMSDPGKIATLVRWFHPRFHRPIYTLDLRHVQHNNHSSTDSVISRGRHFPSPDVEGRVYLDVTSLPVVLHVDPVTPEDAGRYTCRVDYKNSRSERDFVYLDVIEPPKGLIISDNSGRKLEGIIGPYKLETEVNITCESIGGNPTPIIFWTRLKHNEKSGTNRTETSSLKATVSIGPLTRRDQWDRYTCTAYNSQLAPPVSSTVIIELNLPPEELTLEASHQKLVSGDQVTFKCRSTGSHPRAHIGWTKGGLPLSSRETITDAGRVTSSTVMVNVVSADHGQNVSCEAKNPSVPEIILRRTIVLNVQHKPAIKLRSTHRISNLSTGSNITAQYRTQGNPEVFTETWAVDCKELLNDCVSFSTREILQMLLRKNEQGLYECNATNGVGVTSYKIDLNGLYPQKFRKTEKSSSRVASAEDGSQNVTGSPDEKKSDVTFHWSIRISPSNQTWGAGQAPHAPPKLNPGLMSKLEILCWKRNETGMLDEPCLTIIVFAVAEKRSLDFYLLLAGLLAATLCLSSILLLRRKLIRDKRHNAEKGLNNKKGGTLREVIHSCFRRTKIEKEVHCTTELLNQSLSNLHNNGITDNGRQVRHGSSTTDKQNASIQPLEDISVEQPLIFK